MAVHGEEAGLLALFLIVSSLWTAHADVADDGLALQAFIKGLDRPPSPKINWEDTGSVCSWHGVSCTSTPRTRVGSLRLPATGLSGQIQEKTLGRLSSLRVLSLHDNKLFGHLPKDLANCTQLRALYLQNNALSGQLPTLSTLVVQVNLASNNFSSSVPLAYTSLHRLVTLYLQNNSLSGPFPSALSTLPDLAQFSVAFNQLHGTIPVTFQQRFGLPALLGNSFCGRPLFPDCASNPPPLATPPPFSASPFLNSRGNSSKPLSPLLIAGISLGSLFAFVIVVLVLVCVVRKRRGRPEAGRLMPIVESQPTNNQANLSTAKEVSSQQASTSQAPLTTKKLVFLEGSSYTFDLDELLRASAEVLG